MAGVTTLTMTKINELISHIQIAIDEFMWRHSQERIDFARSRLAAHEQAMKDGRNSPYTHPEEYDGF